MLNQDAWVQEGIFDNPIRTAIRNPKYGILSPLHLNGKGDKFDENFSHYAGPGFTSEANLLDDYYLSNSIKEVYETKL